MARQRAFLKFKNVTLYRALKGNSEMTFWYTRTQNNQVEGSADSFDIRRLPKKYRHGLDIEPDYSGAVAPPSAGYMFEPEAFQKISERTADAHRDMLRRAIDDEYDLDAAARGNYLQWLRRLRRRLGNTTRRPRS
jgi:hypothetical protein